MDESLKYFTLRNQNHKMKPRSQNAFSRLISEPLLKFLIISIGIYMAYGFYGKQDADIPARDNTITITARDVDLMAYGWQQHFNRKPTDDELQKLINTRAKETVLYEEAKKMGLDKDDVVIKRRLVLQYRNLIEGLIIPPDPTEEELNLYFQENIDAYIPDVLMSLTQLFFDPDKRGESTLGDAEKTLSELQNRKSLPDNYEAYGDNFMLANSYTNITPLKLRKYFGSGFAQSVLELEPNIWIGPVLSGYGTHLVYVNEKLLPDPPVLKDVKEIVLADYLDDKKKELIEIYMDNVTAQYEVVIEEEATVNK